jgi:hypothetical protein
VTGCFRAACLFGSSVIDRNKQDVMAVTQLVLNDIIRKYYNKKQSQNGTNDAKTYLRRSAYVEPLPELASNGSGGRRNNIQEPCPCVLLILIIFDMPTIVPCRPRILQTTTKRMLLGYVWRCAISNMFYIYFESVANRRVHRHACTALHCMARHGIDGTALHSTAQHLHGICTTLHGICAAFARHCTAFARLLHGLLHSFCTTFARLLHGILHGFLHCFCMAFARLLRRVLHRIWHGLCSAFAWLLHGFLHGLCMAFARPFARPLHGLLLGFCTAICMAFARPFARLLHGHLHGLLRGFGSRAEPIKRCKL